MIPTLAQRRGNGPCDGLGQRRIVHLAEGQRAGHRAAPRGLESGHVAALLVDRDDGRVADADGCAELLQLLLVSDVAREQDDPAETPIEVTEQPVRRRFACEAGQDAGAREALERAAHPLTEPAVRPNAMRRWTMRKNTTTGIAVKVEAAINAPQSVLRLVP